MKNYVFVGLASLSLMATRCAQQSEQAKLPTPEVSNEQPLPEKTEERLLPSWLPVVNYDMFFVGPTTYQSKYNPHLWFSKPLSAPDLGSITGIGKPVNMVAFGGGLTAGVSNGGLNREAQQFAYPNLVARQMGISDFNTPLLNENEANGTGIFLYEDVKSEYPRWRRVTNNLANLTFGEPVKMTPFEGTIHNFAFPNGGVIGATYPYCPACPSQAYSNRFASYKITKDSTLLSSIQKKQDYNFVIMEDFYDAFANWITNAPSLNESFTLAAPYITPTYAMNNVIHKGQKGVVFTIPNFKHLGFMNWYNTADLKNKVSAISISYWVTNQAKTQNKMNDFFLKPTKNVEGLFRTAEAGQPLEAPLDDLDILDESESYIADPERVVNPAVRKFAQKYGLAVVDLAAIFDRIHAGNYITDDGLKIDGSRAGNFFSSDGIYPTPVGQAVIANEVIKAINSRYGAHIPLIDVTEFVKSISSK